MDDWLSRWEPDTVTEPHTVIEAVELEAEKVADIIAEDLTSQIRESLNAFADSLGNGLTAAGDLGVFYGLYEAWKQTTSFAIIPMIQRAYQTGGNQAVAGATTHSVIPAAVGFAFNEGFSYSTQAYLRDRENKIKGIDQVLFAQITAKVSAMVQAGDSPDSIRRAIQEFSNFSEWRADTIARTESLMALSVGQREADSLLGEFGPAEKAWSSTIDERTRDSHAAMSEFDLIPYNDPFIVGGVPMMMPLDPSGPAEEVINCRCGLLRYWPGDKRPDGTVVGMEPILQPTQIEATIDEMENRMAEMLAANEGEFRKGMSIDDLEHKQKAFQSPGTHVTDGERQAIDFYTTADYQGLNNFLRGGDDDGRFNVDAVSIYDEVTDNLDSLIDKAGRSNDPFIVYRGMIYSDDVLEQREMMDFTPAEWEEMKVQRIREKYTIGSEIDFGGGFVSTSTKLDTPATIAFESWDEQHIGLIFEIAARHGAPLQDFSVFSFEHEILLSRDSRYRVMGVEENVGVKKFFDDSGDEQIKRVTMVQLMEIE